MHFDILLCKINIIQKKTRFCNYYSERDEQFKTPSTEGVSFWESGGLLFFDTVKEIDEALFESCNVRRLSQR